MVPRRQLDDTIGAPSTFSLKRYRSPTVLGAHDVRGRHGPPPGRRHRFDHHTHALPCEVVTRLRLDARGTRVARGDGDAQGSGTPGGRQLTRSGMSRKRSRIAATAADAAIRSSLGLMGVPQEPSRAIDSRSFAPPRAISYTFCRETPRSAATDTALKSSSNASTATDRMADARATSVEL